MASGLKFASARKSIVVYQFASSVSVVFLVVLLILAPPPARADYSANVNPSTVVVTNFEGWGTSLCWWANVIGGYPNRDTYADLAFTQLKLNIVRYNIGGGENPAITNTSLATNASAWRAQMPGFEPSNGVWNWNVDTNQRYMLKAALARGVDHVEAFANSPPWWMTISGSVTGATNYGGNNLQTNYEAAFALYLANVISNLTVLDGVHFDTITPMNEPNEGWWVYGGSQEGCNMSTDQQIRMVNDLRAALNASGLSIGIAACEDSYEADSVTSLNQYGSTLTNVSRFVTHTYSANNPTGLHNLAVANNKPLWVSEYGHGDATGMNMARRIHDDLTQMMPSAWVYWQVLDESGSGWGPLANPELASTNSGYTTAYTINESFYVLGQFSQYVRPGCQLISVSDTNSLAAYTASNSTLVIVALNDSSSAFNVTYNLSSFGSVPAHVTAYRTSATENQVALAPLTLTNHQFTSYLPAMSVTTHILTNVVPGLLGLSQDLSPTFLSLYAGMTNTFSVQASGVAPIFYSWLRNGAPISGATNSTYTFALAPGTNTYQCLATNSQGSVSSSVATVVSAPPPQDAYSLGLIADGPLAYWRLNEPAGSTTAFDYIGGHNGTYGANTTNGLAGVPAPPFIGLGNEFAVGMNNTVAAAGAGYVTTAGINLSTNAATLLCWAFPYTSQFNPCGLVYLRSGGSVFGSQIGGSEFLDYTWANNAATYDYGSGLLVPTNMWSFLALAITASNAILYVFNANGQGSATNNVANANQSFAGGFALGADPQSSTLPQRIFNGKLGEVAVFDYPLSAAQLTQLYTVATEGLSLALKRSAGNVVLTWPFGTLQKANSLSGPWTAVAGAASPYTNALVGSQVFYRVAAQNP